MQKLSYTDAELLTMQNKIIPKDKVNSLEQFYKLSTSSSKSIEGVNVKLETPTPAADENEFILDEKIAKITEADDPDEAGIEETNQDGSDLKHPNSSKVDHFKFATASAKYSTIPKINSSITTTTYLINKSNKSNEARKSFPMPNQNFVLNAPSIYPMSTNPQSNSQLSSINEANSRLNKPNFLIRNKVYSIQTDTTDDDYTIMTPAQTTYSNSTKLTYLKRYVANNMSATRNGSVQFSDGHWGNKSIESAQTKSIPKKPKTLIITEPEAESTETQTAVENSKPVLGNIKSGLKPKIAAKVTPKRKHLANYLSYNLNHLNHKEKELTIIDLQLPYKPAPSSINLPHTSLFKNKRNIFRNLQAAGEYYTQSSEFNETNESTNQAEHNLLTSNVTRLRPLNSSILIDSLDYQSVLARVHGSSYLDTSIPDEKINTLNMLADVAEGQAPSLNRSNSFFNKYLINQQKKKLKSLSNSANNVPEIIDVKTLSLSKKNKTTDPKQISNPTLVIPNTTANLTAQMTKETIASNNTENLLITSSLNNLSTNSLLIKKLNF